MFIRILPTTLLQIFCENLLYFQVIFKSMKIADDTFLGNSECKWVNLRSRCTVSYRQGNQKHIFHHLFHSLWTFLMRRLLLSEAEWWKIFEKHINPVMLVFIRELPLSTLRLVPICLGFSHFSGFLHHFVLAKFSTSSIRVQRVNNWSYTMYFLSRMNEWQEQLRGHLPQSSPTIWTSPAPWCGRRELQML